MFHHCYIDVDNATNAQKIKGPISFIKYAKISINKLGKNTNLKITYLYSFIAV